jgi:hypothetical protein
MQQQWRGCIGQEHANRLLQHGHLLLPWAQQYLHVRQHVLERLTQGFGPGRQAHGARAPFEQRIPENMATALQGIGHGRLRQADAGRRAGDMHFVQQGVKGNKQIEIDGT